MDTSGSITVCGDNSVELDRSKVDKLINGTCMANLGQRLAGKEQEALDVEYTHPFFCWSQGPNLHRGTCKYDSDLAYQRAYLQDPEKPAESLGWHQPQQH